MVNETEREQIERYVNDCITKTGYYAAAAFSNLNSYISRLRKEYQESQKHVST